MIGKGFFVDSRYGVVTIRDNKKVRFLYVNDGVMGGVYPDGDFKGSNGFPYYHYMIKIALKSKPKDALVLGIGAGIIPSKLTKEYNINVDAVDINPVVIELAVKYMGLTPSKTLKLHTQDAREYLESTDKKYDVIFMDTYNFIKRRWEIPSHLKTKEYYQLAKKHLNPKGVIILDIIYNDKELIDSQYNIFKSIFDHVEKFSMGNNILIGSYNK